MELDVKNVKPIINLNMGDVDSNKVYVHLGLCSCKENPPFGPENRDCLIQVKINFFVLLK